MLIIKHSQRHLLAMKEDFAIFDTILAPLCKANLLVTCASVPHITNIADDDDPI